MQDTDKNTGFVEALLEASFGANPAKNTLLRIPWQRKLDFDGLEVLPQEQALAEAAAEELSVIHTF